MSENIERLYAAHIDALEKRHEEAMAEAGFDEVVIYAGSDRMTFLDDYAYPFKVNPHFKAWVPVLDNPNCFLTYRPGSRPVLVFYQPADYWHKPAESPNGFWVSRFEIRPIGAQEEAREYLPKGKRTAFIGEWDPAFDSWGFENVNPQGLLDRLHYERAWKTGYEIECMRRANAIGVAGHQAAERAFRAGASEWEIHLDYLRATSHNESELPYGNIVALNEHAAILHYQHQERGTHPKEEIYSFLIDAGAGFNGYASDITRTYSRARDDFQALVDGMDSAQQELCASVKPGLDYRELHLMAHRKVAELLKEFDLVKATADEALEKGITRTFLPHGVGHYIGLQVHDVGGFMADSRGTTIPKPDGHPYLRLTRKIEAKQVFTIEPGLYFIGMLLEELRANENGSLVNWDRVDGFRKYGGVRIEDDIAVTERGHENLTRDQFTAAG